MKKVKECLIIFGVTFMHTYFTILYLNGVPLIGVVPITIDTMISVFLWFTLGATFYFVMQWIVLKNRRKINLLYSVLWGVGVVALKILIDFISDQEQFRHKLFLTLALRIQIETLLFGILMLAVLFFIVGKQKVRRDWLKRSIIPGVAMIFILVAYTITFNGFKEMYRVAAEEYLQSIEQLETLDWDNAFKMLIVNASSYMWSYVTFWWWLRRVTTHKTEENVLESAK